MAADRLVGALAPLNDPWQPAVLEARRGGRRRRRRGRQAGRRVRRGRVRSPAGGRARRRRCHESVDDTPCAGRRRGSARVASASTWPAMPRCSRRRRERPPRAGPRSRPCWAEPSGLDLRRPAASDPQRPERDGAGGGDVERVDAVRHRDRDHDDPRPRARARLSPSPSVPSTSATRSGGVGGEVVERDRVVGEREGRDREAGVACSCSRASGHSVEPRPRHLEHRAHAHAHATVGRAGRRSAGSRAPRPRRVPRPHGRSRRRWCGRRCPRARRRGGHRAAARRPAGSVGPVHRGEGAAVHDEPGDRLEQLGLGEVAPARRTARAPARARRATSRCSSTERGRWPGREGARDHLRRLGDVETAVGFRERCAARRRSGRA